MSNNTRKYLIGLSIEMGLEGEVNDEVVARAERDIASAMKPVAGDKVIHTKDGSKYDITNVYYAGRVDINKDGAIERVDLGTEWILEKLLDAITK